MKVETKILLVLFLLALCFPREAQVSGSAVGTITETHFEISGDDRLRKHFAGSADEYEYHKEERKKITQALRPLVDRIKGLVDRLRKKKPWSTLIQTYSASADPGPDADLKQFESPEVGPWVRNMQEKGSYRYVTSFMHSPGETRPLRVTVRFLFKGKVESESLYELEDGLHALRDTLPADSRYTANSKGVILNASGCDEYKKKLEAIRTEFAERLKQQNLFYRGHEHDGTLFSAKLEGRDMCLADFELTLAGDHHWGRAKKAFITATQGVFKQAIEWPGYPPDPHADLAPWRIIADPQKAGQKAGSEKAGSR
jgi:hypothetical protein